MWPFTKSEPRDPGALLKDGIDWHSHILPGVDDGVRDMDEALAVLRQMELSGIKEVWLTPHIMEDIPNTTEGLRRCFEELKEKYEGGMTLHLGSENMLDTLFEKRLEADDLLPLADNMLLVETSYFSPPIGFTELLEVVGSRGYRPVLAHPERYVYMDTDFYRRLKEMGIMFQQNVWVETGIYGKNARQKARWLKSHGYYDLAGTDLHSLVQLIRQSGAKPN